MNNKRIFSIILALTTISANMVACQKTTQINETKYFKLDIDSEKEYFDDESSNVKEIKDFLETFMNQSFNCDYTRSDEEIIKHLYLYTDEVIESDEVNGYHDYYLGMQKEREYMRTLVDYEVEEVEFYKVLGEEYANVSCNDIAIITNATEEYRENANIKLNQKYKTHREYRLRKQSDGWRVSDVLFVDDRVEVE